MKKLSQLFRASGRRHSRPTGQQRRLSTQALERRQLLAGDLGMVAPEISEASKVSDSPVQTQTFNQLHNYHYAYDVNQDFQLTPLDALMVINAMRRDSAIASGESVETAAVATTDNDLPAAKIDVNDDGKVSPIDALQVINAIRRGEGEPDMDDLVSLFVTPRDLNDDALTPGADGIFTVDANEDFFLEVSYTDLRFPSTQAFAVFTDLLVGQVQTDANGEIELNANNQPIFAVGNGGNLRPVLTETLLLEDPNSIESADGFNDFASLTFTVEGGTETRTVDFDDQFSLRDGLTDFLSMDLGFDPADFEVIVGNVPDSDGNVSRETRVRYINYDSFAGQDLPDIFVEANAASGNASDNRSFATTDITPQTSDGQVSSLAIRENLNFSSRSFNGAEIYTLVPRGEFDPNSGFTGIGGSADAAPDPGNSRPPLDAFSLRVEFTNPTPNIDVLATAPSVNDFLLVDRNEAVPAGLIDISEAVAQFRVEGDVVVDPVVINDGNGPSLAEDGPAVTFDLSTLVSSGTPTAFNVSGANGGVGTVSGSTLTFTPDADFFGTATVSVTATDGSSTDNATVSFEVTPVNDAPNANADSISTASGTDVSVTTATLIANDDSGAANENDSLTITDVAATSAQGGTVTLSGDTVTYSPPAGLENTSDTFTYTLSDGDLTATGTVTVAIGAAPITPDINDIADQTGDEDTDFTLDLSQFVTNGAENVVFSLDGASNFGTAAINGNTLTLTPPADQSGTATLTVVATNGVGSDSETFDVVINPVNDAPVAVDDSVATDEDTPLEILISTLLANDNVGPGETGDVTFVSAASTSAQGGTIVTNPDTLIYNPPANFSGTDSFTYTISDGALTDVGTVTITVNDTISPPVLNNAVLGSLVQGQMQTFDLTTLDIGEDGVDSFAVVASDNAAATIDGTTLLITAGNDLGFAQVTVSGTNVAGTANADITFNVIEMNLAPTGGPIVRDAVSENDGVQTFSLLDGFTDPNNDTLSVVADSINIDAANGVTVSPAGIVSVDPSAFAALTSAQSQTVTITYTVTDGELTAPGNATITIDGFSQIQRGDFTETLNANGTTTIDLLTPAVIGDRNAAGLTATATLVDPSQGTLTDNGDGTFVFAPAAGNDDQRVSINYAVSIDGGSTISSGTIIVNDFDITTASGSIFQDSLSNLTEFLAGADPEFNGVQDEGEAGFAGIPVRLRNNTTGAETVVLTDLSGRYNFDDLIVGDSYTLTVELPDSIDFDSANDSLTQTFTALTDGNEGPVISPIRFNTGLDYLDALARTYVRRDQALADQTNNGNEGGTVVMGDGTSGPVFRAGEGFEGATFAEFVMNDSMDAALLTVIMGDSVLTAEVGSEFFLPAQDGSAAIFFGGMDDFTFREVDPSGDNSADQAEFEGYLASIDQVLQSL